MTLVTVTTEVKVVMVVTVVTVVTVVKELPFTQNKLFFKVFKNLDQKNQKQIHKIFFHKQKNAGKNIFH